MAKLIKRTKTGKSVETPVVEGTLNTSISTKFGPSETPGHVRAADTEYVVGVYAPFGSGRDHELHLSEEEMLRTVSYWLGQLAQSRRRPADAKS